MDNFKTTVKDEELEKLVGKYFYPEEGEEDKLNEILCTWKEHTPFWLLYVESKIGASPTDNDSKKLIAVYEEAILNKALMKAYREKHDELDPVNIMQKLIVNFTISDEEVKQANLLDKLEEVLCNLETEPSHELDQFLHAIDLENQPNFIQHQAYKIIYCQLDSGYVTEVLTAYSTSNNYQIWLKKFDTKNILNLGHEFENAIKEFCFLEKKAKIVTYKNNYQYRIDNNMIEQSFSDFFELASSCFDFCKDIATEQEVYKFEQDYNAKLPKEIKHFYQTFGHFFGDEDAEFSLWSLKYLRENIDSELNDSLQSMKLTDGFLAHAFFGEDDELKCFISEEDRIKLDEEYTIIGYVNLHGGVPCLILYTDKQGICDFIFFDDEGCDYSNEYLKEMLDHSPARFSPLQLIYALLIPTSTQNFGCHYNWEKDLWANFLRE